MLEYAKNKPPLELEAQIARVAAERNKLYNMLDEATEE
jgi:hypothetical protein